MIRLSQIGLIAVVMVYYPHIAGASADDCQDVKAVWHHKDGKHEYFLTIKPSANIFAEDVNIVRQQDGITEWTLHGEIFCSQGASVCKAIFPIEGEVPHGRDIVVEGIDIDGNGTSEMIVFAAAGQSLWYSGGAQVSWQTDIPKAEAEERQLIPNWFQRLRCAR